MNQKLKKPKKILASKESETDKAFKDFLDFTERHSSGGSTSVTVMGEPTGVTNGYYTMFVKRDENLPKDQRVILSSMGRNMPLEDIISAFQTVLHQIMDSHENTPVA